MRNLYIYFPRFSVGFLAMRVLWGRKRVLNGYYALMHVSIDGGRFNISMDAFSSAIYTRMSELSVI